MPISRKIWQIAFSISLAACCVLPTFALAQRYNWRDEIDQVVQLADSLSLSSQYTFHLNKFDKKDRAINETWHYTLYNGQVIIFEVHFFIDSMEHDEIYYLNKGQMVCMEEYEIVNPFTDDDEIIWGSVGFFSQRELKQHIVMGKPDYPNGRYDEWDAFKKFRDRYRELLENRSLMEKNSKDVIFAP